LEKTIHFCYNLSPGVSLFQLEISRSSPPPDPSLFSWGTVKRGDSSFPPRRDFPAILARDESFVAVNSQISAVQYIACKNLRDSCPLGDFPALHSALA